MERPLHIVLSIRQDASATSVLPDIEHSPDLLRLKGTRIANAFGVVAASEAEEPLP